ncbi:hypothetical protein [uncultured Acidovorax sp.]|uniref:hypothetical protein n=1 Tax=uncultured Acidovorax sp. TaxID=158751 RepID=UPI00258FC5AC|nr:hypothetical protein [uncultured Acidovorax sp.]
MNEPKKAYSYGHLITIATIADEIAIARGTVGHDELRDLAKRFASGELKTPPLFPPHQLWQHGGDASRIGAATPDPDGVWRILFKKTSKPHQSDKDAFNHPPSAYTWHMLAADVYELGQQPVWKTQTAAALRNLVWCLKSNHQIMVLAARATDAKMVSALLCHTNGLGSSL